MKKIILSFLAIALSFGAFAQQTPLPVVPKDTIRLPQPVPNPMVYLMLDGKMYSVKDSVKVELTQNVTLKNGTLVTTDGKVRKPDDSTIMLRNGQYIDEDGNMGNWKNKMKK